MKTVFIPKTHSFWNQTIETISSYAVPLSPPVFVFLVCFAVLLFLWILVDCGCFRKKIAFIELGSEKKKEEEEKKKGE